MDKFGPILRMLLEERELDGKDFAKVLNVAQPTVSNWINGNRSPNQEMLIIIADYFEVSVDFLLGRTKMRKLNADMLQQIALENNLNPSKSDLSDRVKEHFEKYDPEKVNLLAAHSDNLDDMDIEKVIAFMEGLKAGKKRHDK